MNKQSDLTWEETEEVLKQIKYNFCLIHETPDKEKTKEQFELLDMLRKEARAIGDIRYDLVRE